MNVFNNVVGAQPVSELSASSAQSEVKAQMYLDSYTAYAGGARLSLSAAHATGTSLSCNAIIRATQALLGMDVQIVPGSISAKPSTGLQTKISMSVYPQRALTRVSPEMLRDDFIPVNVSGMSTSGTNLYMSVSDQNQYEVTRLADGTLSISRSGEADDEWLEGLLRSKAAGASGFGLSMSSSRISMEAKCHEAVAHAGTVFLYTDTDQSPPRLAVGGTLGVFKTDGVMSRSSVYALPLSTLEGPKEVQTAKVVGIIPMVDYASGGYLRTPDQSMVAIAAASVPPSGNSDSDNVRAYLESMRELNPTFFQTLVEQAEAANMPTPIL